MTPIQQWTEANFPEARQLLLTHRQLKSWLDIICESLGLEPPIVRGGRSDDRAETDGLVIWLPPRGQSFHIALHELSHIIETRAGRSGEHTREFIQTLIDLCERHMASDPKLLSESAREMGLL